MKQTYQQNQCPNCGNSLTPGAQFCTNCGQKIVPVAVPQNPVPQPGAAVGQTPINLKLLTRWLGIAGAAVFAGTGFLMAFIPYNLFYNLMLALHNLGQGAFMLAVALFMMQKLEK